MDWGGLGWGIFVWGVFGLDRGFEKRNKKTTHFPNCLLLYADSFAVQGLMIVSEGET